MEKEPQGHLASRLPYRTHGPLSNIDNSAYGSVWASLRTSRPRFLPPFP